MPKQQCRNPRSSRLRLGAIITIVLVLVAVTASAQASSTANNDTASQQQDPAVAMYATEYSVSTQEAARRLKRIEPLHELMAAIRETETHRLAGWGIDHSPIFTGWVLLTGTNPATSTSTATVEANPDLEIRTGATHTYDQLLQAKKELYRIGPIGQVNNPNNKTSISDIISFTAVDMSTNAVEIGIDPPPLTNNPHQITNTGPLGTTDETFKAQAAAFTTNIAPHINVAYTVVDGRGLTNHANFLGGQAISRCTAGFTARKGNQYGIITAGHCMGTMIMNGYRLESINGGKSPTADARFDAIPTGQEHRVLDDFICGNDTLTVCDVFGTRTRSQMAGAFICHTGVKSGYSCGTVTAIDYRPNNAIACFEEDDLEEDDSLQCDDVFVRVEGRTLRGCRGDSGGPWFQGARALGIHSGGNDPDNCGDHADGKKWLYFSAIHEVEDYLELSILTQGSVTVN